MSPSNSLQALNLLNPMAPPVYGGMTTPDGPVDFTYPFDITMASGADTNDAIKTNTDADFQLLAIIANVYTSIEFGILLNVNGVYYLSPSPILAGNFVADPSAPPPVLGKFIIPRGADLNIRIVNYSGATNTVQLLFRGMKLYGSR